MGYNNNVYKEAYRHLFERRISAEKAADRRREEIYVKIPEIKELERQISLAGVKAARAVLAGGDVKKNTEKLRDENLALQARLRTLLEKNGFSKNSLEVCYRCTKCSDTGKYEANGRTVMCSCLKNELVLCACNELNRHAPLELSTFDKFSLDFYDRAVDPQAGVSPYEQMSRVLKYCKSYAANFMPHSQSLLMTGATGLGKTHLSLAIANEVIKSGFGVIYASAPKLLSKLEKLHFSNSDDDSELNLLLDCDLLIIDDLGTEFHTQFSSSQLYNIFNSRMLSGKPVIINTNLKLLELEKLYTDRFVSRICGSALKLDFIGRDVRIRVK